MRAAGLRQHTSCGKPLSILLADDHPALREGLRSLLSSREDFEIQGEVASGGQERITKIVITLDKKGVLQKVQVLEESGIRDLDDAAVEAFRAAAPFPITSLGNSGE